jgi:hypothetical protein
VYQTSTDSGIEYSGRSDAPGIDGSREGVNMGLNLYLEKDRVVEINLFIDSDPL